MSKTLDFIKNRFALDLNQESPIALPFDRLNGLCGLFRELGFKIGAEVGVSRGLYSKWLSVKVRGLKLYCVDPYEPYKEYSKHVNQALMDEFERHAHQRLAKFNCIFIKKFSMDAVKDFEDNSLDFVYIDANHSFKYVVNDIAEWEKKVKIGGIVAGHDYSDFMFEVKAAVDGWMKANRINPWFITSEKHPSWFYVKQKDNTMHRQFREKLDE